jgi:hypothetical protein
MFRTCRFNRLAALFLCFFSFLTASFPQTSGGVKGKVRDWNGNGLAGITVSARQNGLPVKEVTSGTAGDFVLDGLVPGIYNIAFEGNGYSTGVLYKMEIKGGKIRSLGNRLLLTRDRGSLVYVKGIVFYRDSTSLGGATVELYQLDENGTLKKIAGTTTDFMGEFSFPGLSTIRKLRVKATFKGVSETKDVEVIQPEVYRTTLILPIDRAKN